MKSFFKKTLLVAGSLLPSLAFGQTLINNEWRSITSGIWDINTSWEKWRFASQAWITNGSGGGPDRGIPKTTVRAGHDIIFATTAASGGSPQSIAKTFIEAGATVKSSGDTMRQVRMYGDSIVISGQLGGNGPESWIDLQSFQGSSTGYTTHSLITGTGTMAVYSLRYGVSASGLGFSDTMTIDKDLTLSGGLLSTYNNSLGNSANDNLIFNLNAGRTITGTDSTVLHMRTDTTSRAAGKMTYNINGTLDLSGSTGNSNITPSSVTASSVTTVNVNGKIKLGTRFNSVNSAPGATNGSVALNINSGGTVEAIATTVPNSKFMFSPWITNTGGTFRRIVTAADTVFPVMAPASVNNSVVLSFAGTKDTFGVNVKTGYSFTWLATDKLVNREWTISKSGSGAGTLNAKLMWTTIAQNPGFSPTAPVSVYVFTGTTWKEKTATLTGAGTAASPYIASVGGLDSFKVLVVGNSGVVLPGNSAGVHNVYQNGLHDIIIAPNPVTNGTVSLSIGNMETGSYAVAVYDATGRKIAAQTVSHTKGSTQAYHVILPAGTSTGTYYISVSNGSYAASQKLIVE